MDRQRAFLMRRLHLKDPCPDTMASVRVRCPFGELLVSTDPYTGQSAALISYMPGGLTPPPYQRELNHHADGACALSAGYLIRFQQTAIKETGRRPLRFFVLRWTKSCCCPGCQRPGYAFWQPIPWQDGQRAAGPAGGAVSPQHCGISVHVPVSGDPLSSPGSTYEQPAELFV